MSFYVGLAALALAVDWLAVPAHAQDLQQIFMEAHAGTGAQPPGMVSVGDSGGGNFYMGAHGTHDVGRSGHHAHHMVISTDGAPSSFVQTADKSQSGAEIAADASKAKQMKATASAQVTQTAAEGKSVK